MAPLAPTKIRTKKEKKTKQNVSDVQLESSAELKNSKTGLQLSTLTMMGKKSKKPVPERERSFAEEDEGEDQDEDDDTHLHGFSTDDDDSSDEENAMDDEPSAFDFGKLPTIARDDATVKQKLEKAKRQPVHLLFSLTKYLSLVDSIFFRQKTAAWCSLDVYLTDFTKINSRLTFHNLAMFPGYVSLAIKKLVGLFFIHPITINFFFQPDWQIEALRIHRVWLILSCPNCFRHHG